MRTTISRRGFLQQSVAFSALLASHASFASPTPIDRSAKHALILGDWGWQVPSEGQSQVATAMRDYVRGQQIIPEALLLLGDSWYGDLTGGADSPRWQIQFENMYPEDVLPGPAYTVVGNHDYQRAPVSKVDAELEYAQRSKTATGRPMRWRLPSLRYPFELPSRDPILTVIALDSNVPGHKSFGNGFYTMTDAMRMEQLAWFEAELAKPRSTPFLAVMAHHPIYSNGKHGDHEVLIRDWDPLLRKYGVHLYFAGHDHDLQHLEFKGHPTSFFLSGAGGADLYNLRESGRQRGPFAQRVYGFSHLEMHRDRLILRHVDEQGNILHAFAKEASGNVILL